MRNGEGWQQAVTIGSRRRVTGTSLRNRILAIALVPSLSLLVLGGAASGYFLYQGFRKQEFANRVSDGNPTISRFVVALQEERRASMAYVVAGASQKPGMAQQRKLTDGQFAEGQQIQGRLQALAPDDLKRTMGITLTTLGELPRVRQRVDAGQSSVQDLDTTYSGMVASILSLLQELARYAPDAETSYLEQYSVDYMEASESMQRSRALAVAAFSRIGLNDQQFQRFGDLRGNYRQLLDSKLGSLTRLLSK